MVQALCILGYMDFHDLVYYGFLPMTALLVIVAVISTRVPASIRNSAEGRAWKDARSSLSRYERWLIVVKITYGTSLVERPHLARFVPIGAAYHLRVWNWNLLHTYTLWPLSAMCLLLFASFLVLGRSDNYYVAPLIASVFFCPIYLGWTYRRNISRARRAIEVNRAIAEGYGRMATAGHA